MFELIMMIKLNDMSDVSILQLCFLCIGYLDFQDFPKINFELMVFETSAIMATWPSLNSQFPIKNHLIIVYTLIDVAQEYHQHATCMFD